MSNIWLEAHADPVANLHTFQSCITLSNVYGQTNHQCVIADNGNLSWPPKLKVKWFVVQVYTVNILLF